MLIVWIVVVAVIFPMILFQYYTSFFAVECDILTTSCLLMVVQNLKKPSRTPLFSTNADVPNADLEQIVAEEQAFLTHVLEELVRIRPCCMLLKNKFVFNISNI